MRNAKPFADLSLQHPAISQQLNLRNITFDQFRPMVILASVAATMLNLHSSFGGGISKIVRLRSIKYMTGSNAGRIVAVVACLPLRQSPIRQEHGKTMGADTASVNADVSVTSFVSVSLPDPARTKIRTMRWNGAVLVHKGPEPLYRSDLLLCHSRGPF